MELLPLKNIVEFIRTGKTPPTKEIKYFDGDIQWYSPGDLDKGKYLEKSKKSITLLAFEDKKAVSYPTGTLLVTCIGEIGKLGITNKTCSSNQQITAIKPKDNVDVNYLFYWFKKHKKQLQDLANNAVVPILNNRNLGKVEVAFPLLEDQKKIADILDAADSLRQKDKQLVEHYDRLSQSLFLDMFGDPIKNNKKLNVISLEKLGKWQSGGTPSRRILNYYEGDIPWLSSGELNQMYTSNSKEHITEQAIKDSNTKLIEKGSLLLGMYDTAALKSTINTEVVACNQAIAYCKLNEDLVNVSFVYHAIQIAKEHYKSLQRGVRQKNLNLSIIKSIEILYPDFRLQNDFSVRAGEIENQKTLAQQALLKSEDLFNSLLQQAFKGELTNR